MRNGRSGVKSFARSFQMLSHKSAKSSRKFDICPVASTKLLQKTKAIFIGCPSVPQQREGRRFSRSFGIRYSPLPGN